MLLVVPKYKLWFSFPHLGILYIASSARTTGMDVELVDGGILSEKEYFYQIYTKTLKHEYIALTVSVAHVASAVETAKFIREHFPEKKIIWGGPYPTSQSEKVTSELADIIVLGEGEKQISQICMGQSLTEIPSIIYYENGEKFCNIRDGYIEDLDSLPFPAFDLVNLTAYNHPGLKPTAQVISSRGCPYNCINCTKIIHGDLYRKRSPENVVEEISWLVNRYGVREIHFWDDNLTLDVRRVKEICSFILERNLQKKVRFAVPSGIRADIYDEEMFSLMKRAGFYLFSVAIESGEQRIIDRIGKRLDLSKVPENLKKLENHGFRLMLYFMMGFPFETEYDMDKTANFAGQLSGHHISCFAVTPLPGSKLFEEWKQTPDFQNYLEVNYDNPIPQARSEEQNRKLRKKIRKAYLKFYLNPVRLLKTVKLMLIEGVFFNDLIFAVKSFINIIIRGRR